MEYKEYLEKWIQGIPSEIKFWDKLMESRGKVGGSEYVFNFRIAPDTPFLLEDELEHCETTFLDVGSGPFSNCGIKTSKTNLFFTAVDPLATIYQKIKIKHNISSPITPLAGTVEMLGEQFDKNSFDIVHISNALDHCFDPMEGIRQMLYVCKIHGKLILRHNANEAEKNHYRGLHQWNIEIEEGKFILWNKDMKIDVGEEIKDFAIVEKAQVAQEKILDSNWTYIKIVIRKVKDFELIKNKYSNIIIQSFLEEICKLNM